MASPADGLAPAVAGLSVDAPPPHTPPVFPYSRTLGRTALASIVGRPDRGAGLAGARVSVGGWVRTGREAGKGALAFVVLSDGTTARTLQCVVAAGAAAPVGGLKAVVPAGTALLLDGVLAAPVAGTEAVELKVSGIRHVGACDNGVGGYPLAGKKRHTLEHLRAYAHLRARTATIGAVARVRSCLVAATHAFFRGKGFQHVASPIITAADCEGAGEMFQVTTLLADADGGGEEAPAASAPDAAAVAALDAAAAAAGARVRDLKAAKAPADEVKAAVATLLAAKEAAAAAAAGAAPAAAGGLPRTPAGAVDYARDFFGKPAFLTVSGQLNAEYYALALSAVYTFGPTFRAEQSHTGRHLAEFWMVEPELAFADLADDMACAEDYVRHCCRAVLAECGDELAVLEGMAESDAAEAVKGGGAAPADDKRATARARLEAVAATPFVRLSYTDAVATLEAEVAAGRAAFEFPVSWGVDLSSEHERFLTDVVHRGPVIVHDYPASIKAFYMRANEDGRTVAAMDVLVPGVGELVGGSQREERLDVLTAKIEALGVPLAAYGPYLDTRRFGSVPHAGFGVGFERLVQFVTGVDNIRDVIPFPRWPGHADF